MRAVMCRELVGVDGLQLEEVSEPLLGPGAVRIRVIAAALNPPDLLMAAGKYQVRPTLPFAIGLEAAGVVEEVGNGCEEFAPGDRVMTYAGVGCLAEQVVVDASLVHPMPEHLGFEEAAGVTLAYGTVHHGLVDRGDLAAGEVVTVLGAAGGLGIAAIHLAKAIGAVVVAVASSEEKLAACRAAGADHLFLTDVRALKGQILEVTDGAGAHVVHDTVGGDLTLAALRGLRPYGRHLVVGYASRQIPAIPGNYLLLKQVAAIGVSYRQFAQQHSVEAKQSIAGLVAGWARRGWRPPPPTIYRLEEFRAAVEAMRTRRAIGKQVIAVSSPPTPSII